MKKLILLALVAVGVGVLVRWKSEQIKSGAARVTRDPRVQSALATAAPYAEAVKEKAAPVADTVKERVADATTVAQERLHKGDNLTPPDVPAPAEEVAEQDPVSAPEFKGADSVAPEPAVDETGESDATGQTPARPTGDPLTDPLPPEDGPAQP